MTTPLGYSKSQGVHPLSYVGTHMTTYEFTDYKNHANDYVNSWGPTNGPDYYYKYTSGTRTPDFHRRRKAGELLPHTPYTQIEISGEWRGVYDIVQNTGTIHNRNYVPNWNTRPISDCFTSIADLQTMAEDQDFSYEIQRAASKVASAGHDTLTFIAEVHKLRTLFTGTLKKAIGISENIVNNYGRGSLDRFKNILDAIQGLWLEQRYGYRTLVFDMIEIERTLNNLSDGAIQRVSERQGSSYEYTSQTLIPFSGSVVSGNHVATTTTSVSVRGSVTADIVLENFRTNVGVTAWELVPYSFVIDWFWNVNQAISALSFLAFAHRYSSSGGVKITSRTENVTVVDSWGSGYSGTYKSDTDFQITLNKRYPTPVGYSPLWRTRLDGWKVLDLLALLSQFALRR